jgi:uncharacterized membrane protein
VRLRHELRTRLCVHGRLDRPARALEHVLLEGERTHDDDPSYGLRKLVDIALRSIASSPFEDPTTAAQALPDQLGIGSGRDVVDGDGDGDGRVRARPATIPP